MIGWGGFSLVHRRAGRAAMLREVRRRLPRGGPVLLSFFARADESRELRLTRAIANALRGRGRERAELGDTLAPNLVHVFTPPRLAQEIDAAGLELAAYRTIAPADEATNYACAIARAT